LKIPLPPRSCCAQLLDTRALRAACHAGQKKNEKINGQLWKSMKNIENQ